MQSILMAKANSVAVGEGEMVELSPDQIETVSGGVVLAAVGAAIVIYLYLRALKLV